jgi:hypothetical protein
MFGMVGGGKEMLELFDPEDSGQLFVGGPRWQIEWHRGPAQGVDIEKPDGGRHNVARTPGELAFAQEMVERVSNLLRGELIGRPLVVGGEARDGLHILILGAGGFAMELQWLDHFGTSW